MRKFGIEFSDRASLNGFAKAKLFLGEYEEQIWCDTTIWSVDNYRDHWIDGRERLISGLSPVVFCSSLSKKSLTVWPAKIQGADLVVFNFVCSRDEMILSGLNIEFGLDSDPLPDDDDDEISRWNIPLRLLYEQKSS